MSNRSFCAFYTDRRAFQEALRRALPDVSPRHIMIKPNWVKHESSPAFPIRALVTDPDVIDMVLECCLEAYPDAETITVGDVPLQSCDFALLRRQGGVDRLEEKYANHRSPRVVFKDLRRQRYGERSGFLQLEDDADGDERGYRDVILDDSSFLEHISDEASRFRVSDYDPALTVSSHHRGWHRYRIAATVLAADLVINVPKMKTHQKSGITGALKNLVGINGEKVHLVHYRVGRPRHGGDEFPPDVPWLVVCQNRIRDIVQRRSRILFRLLRPGWQLAKRIGNVKTVGTPANLEARRFYIAAGSWHGNDTIWRMVYDLNRIVRYAPPEGGVLVEAPQRHYVVVLDGIVAGEGNGPLQALPVGAGVLGVGNDPFLMDMAMATLMGFSIARIPMLAHHADFGAPDWGSFDVGHQVVSIDGEDFGGLDALPTLHHFQPPPGWRGHIERAGPDPEREGQTAAR